MNTRFRQLKKHLFRQVPFFGWALCVIIALGGHSANSFAAAPVSDYYCETEVMGYYPDYYWMPIPEIRYDHYTHVIFFSIYPDTDGSLKTDQIDLTRQATFVQRARDNGVGVLICVGGWGLSGGFGPMAADATARAAFISNLTNYCLNYNFDGVVLDWEPVSTATDRSNYTLLIQELKTALSTHNLSLTVAVLAQGIEFYPSAIPSIDRLHIMAYDMSNDSHHSSYEDAVSAIAHWENVGFPKSKIILGLPFYGRELNWWYVESYEPYSKIIADYQPAPDVDEVNGIYFNGIDTIRQKTRFVVDNRYRGVMCWELAQDTQDSTSLLISIRNEILLRRRPDFNCDNFINQIDLIHLISHWLSTDCSSENNWCDATDLNQSNALTLKDFSIFAQCWMFNQ